MARECRVVEIDFAVTLPGFGPRALVGANAGDLVEHVFAVDPKGVFVDFAESFELVISKDDAVVQLKDIPVPEGVPATDKAPAVPAVPLTLKFILVGVRK